MGEKRNRKDELALDLFISINMVQIIEEGHPLHEWHTERIKHIFTLLGGDKDE